jgi:hypothetical protein
MNYHNRIAQMIFFAAMVAIRGESSGLDGGWDPLSNVSLKEVRTGDTLLRFARLGDNEFRFSTNTLIDLPGGSWLDLRTNTDLDNPNTRDKITLRLGWRGSFEDLKLNYQTTLLQFEPLDVWRDGEIATHARVSRAFRGLNLELRAGYASRLGFEELAVLPSISHTKTVTDNLKIKTRINGTANSVRMSVSAHWKYRGLEWQGPFITTLFPLDSREGVIGIGIGGSVTF